MGKIIKRVRKRTKKKINPSQRIFYPTLGSNWVVGDLSEQVLSNASVSKAVVNDIINYAEWTNKTNCWILQPNKKQFQAELLKDYYQQQFDIVDVIDSRIVDDYLVVSDFGGYYLPEEEKSPEETLRNRILAGINYLIPTTHIEQQNIIAIQELIKEYDVNHNTNALLQAYYLWSDQKNKHAIYFERCVNKLTQFIKRIIRLTSGFKLNLRLWFRTLFHFLFKALDDESSHNYLLIPNAPVLINSKKALNKNYQWTRKKSYMI
jgi:hypothetical protein